MMLRANTPGRLVARPPAAVQQSASIIVPRSQLKVAPGLPKIAAEHVEYEAELAVVIGKGASRISVTDALEHVAGYTSANNVSARDLQM